MNQEYDDEIKRNAQKFAELDANFNDAEDRLKNTQREFDAAKTRREEMKTILSKYVGRNTRRRVVKLTSGNVVVISYESDNYTSVEIHDVL